MTTMQHPLFTMNFKGFAVGVNHKFVNRQFAISQRYRNFKEAIAVCTNGSLGFAGDVELHIEMWISKPRDSDNLLKPLFDGMEMSGVFLNDNQITYYTVRKHRKKRGEDDRIIVRGYPDEGETADTSAGAAGRGGSV